MTDIEAGWSRGRVLDVSPYDVTLFRAGRVHTVPRPSSGLERCRPGDLLASVDGRLQVVRAYPEARDFPAPGSDADRLLRPDRWENLRRRAAILTATRRWFSDAGFLEVETPTLVRCPGTEVHLDPIRADLVPCPGSAPEDRWLITSPEHHMKRLLVAGAPPIYQLSRVFRDGERGRNHRPEFSMLEWYRPWAGYEALMDDCEALVQRLVGRDSLTFGGATVQLASPWPRLTFHDALRQLGGVAEPERLTADQQLEVLVAEVEPKLGFGQPVFLTEYPISMASLARPKPDDPSVAERFELYVAGLELGNAFGELTDAAEQRRRCLADNAERRSKGRPELPLDEAFLAALEDGMPPSAGIAVGFDRLVMLVTGAPSIDEVLPF